MTEEKPDIDLIPGHTSILLIAPHGHDSDDKNTGKLVRLIADQSGSYAIINEFYQKPDDPNDDKTADKQDKRVNLNRKRQVETHLRTDFLDPLIKYKNEIIKRFGNVFLIWIHGADDDSVPKGIQVVVGYGQGETDKSHTADIDTIDALIKGLNENNLTAVKAGSGGNKFCARDINNMNQYFRLQGENNFDILQSFQLEFRMTGCRDTDESLKSTARDFINSISFLVEPVEKVIEPADKKEQPADKDQVPEKIIDPDEIKGAIDIGGPVYDPLVETAYEKLSHIFSKNYEQALMEAGQYLARTFYAGEEAVEDLEYDKDLVLDQEIIENARNKKSPRQTSLNKLIEKIEGDKTSRTPSRSWIINSVNLIVQDYDIKKELKPLVHTYGQLLLSHKICLLKVKDLNIKQALIEEESKNPSTVKDFIQKIEKLLPPDPEKALTLPALLKSPEELMKDENAEKLSLEALKSTQTRTLEKLKKIIKDQRDHVFSEINAFQQRKNRYHQFLEKYSAIENNIDKLIEQKKTPEKKSSGFKSANKMKEKKENKKLVKVKKSDEEKKLRKLIKNNEWTKSKNNFNISTGCSNDCLYCYGRYMPYARKLAKDAKAKGEEWNWGEPTIRQKDVQEKQSLRDGRVGFPTSHDITPDNLQDYLKALKKILEAGNDVMIISKPRMTCIQTICQAFPTYKDKILFRFTITAKTEEVLSFWEPNAPSYDERWEALKYAFDKGFQTSVSMEPMLEYSRAEEMVQDFMPFVTDAIWFGKIDHIPAFKDPDGHLKEELAKVEAGHADENIKHLYSIYKDNPKIKWKLAYKEVLGIPLPPAPGMDV